MVAFSHDTDVGQGYTFRPEQQQPFGYITSWAIGDYDIAPDIKVVDPARPGDGYTMPVVSVLQQLTWSTQPTEPITVQGRISLANAQQLQTMARQSTAHVVMQIGLVIHQYDPVAQAYYTAFETRQGVPPNGTRPRPGAPAGAVYALPGRTPPFTVNAKVEEDPIGIRNHQLQVVLSPPAASGPQQLQLQTSTTAKAIQPWGLPQT